MRGKIVVVGATAPVAQDLHPTSTTGSALMPGPEIQASAILTALEGFPLKRRAAGGSTRCCSSRSAATPLAALRLRIFLGAAIGALALAALPRRRPVRLRQRHDLTVVYPVARRRSSRCSATAAIHGVTVAFEREQARDAFARFVPEAVVDQVLAAPTASALGGVQREATVMFSDLRGFTSFTETLEPEQVIESLNRYLTEMSEAILDHGGTLVAYMGDGIMAVFGAPLAAGRPRRPGARRRRARCSTASRASTSGCARRGCTTASRWASGSTAAR